MYINHQLHMPLRTLPSSKLNFLYQILGFMSRLLEDKSIFLLCLYMKICFTKKASHQSSFPYDLLKVRRFCCNVQQVLGGEDDMVLRDCRTNQNALKGSPEPQTPRRHHRVPVFKPPLHVACHLHASETVTLLLKYTYHSYCIRRQ